MEAAWNFPGLVFVRVAKQECDLHASCRSGHPHLVEATTIATRRFHPACSLFVSRNSACSANRVVGSASRGSNRARMDTEWDAASDAGRTRRLFLFCQSRLAREPCLYLSAVATRKRLVLFVPHNSAWRAGASLDFTPANRKRAVCGSGAFIITLGPILGFMNCYAFQFSYVADHW